jgi:hypothetical protein
MVKRPSLSGCWHYKRHNIVDVVVVELVLFMICDNVKVDDGAYAALRCLENLPAIVKCGTVAPKIFRQRK